MTHSYQDDTDLIALISNIKHDSYKSAGILKLSEVVVGSYDVISMEKHVSAWGKYWQLVLLSPKGQEFTVFSNTAIKRYMSNINDGLVALPRSTAPIGMIKVKPTYPKVDFDLSLSTLKKLIPQKSKNTPSALLQRAPKKSKPFTDGKENEAPPSKSIKTAVKTTVPAKKSGSNLDAVLPHESQFLDDEGYDDTMFM